MPKRLTLEMIENSPEIQDWLNQFSEVRRTPALVLLMHLQFVSRDEYAEWLKLTVSKIPAIGCSLYAVRKFRPKVICIWNKRGITLPRPATSLGSEDLVTSVIASLVRTNEVRYHDHPSMTLVRQSKAFHAVLIDDSSGSEDRISSFVRRMFSSKTFLSRWSFGWVHLHIVAYARSVEGEELIIESIPGSDHGRRKFSKSTKITFHGHLAYRIAEIGSRWGEHAMQIRDLCDAVRAVPADRRRGYGNTMSNLVFYHSVPNNIPGMLFCQNNKWNALFPKRGVPAWLPKLLEGQAAPHVTTLGKVSENLLNLLLMIKRGRRTEIALARGLGFDPSVVRGLLARTRAAGFLSKNNRLTETGAQMIWDNIKAVESIAFDSSLYIPSKWCAGRVTVQPSGLGELARREKTESASGSPRADGGVGQTPLERTGAMTAMPSLRVTTQDPSIAREGGDTHGPLG